MVVGGMTQNIEITEQVLRQFFLGNVDNEERERIEILFMTQLDARQRVLVAEQDLIEDYLDDLLTPSDKSRFVQRYADTPHQQRKLMISRLVHDWAWSNSQRAKTHFVPILAWHRFAAWLRFQRVVLIPITVTAVIAILIAGVWLNNANKRERHWAIEEELARLNRPSAVLEAPSQTISTTIAPVSVRSAVSEHELKLSSGIRVVEVHLLWIQKENYTRYDAIVRRIDAAEAFTVENLQAQKQRGLAISVRLPAHMLTSGVYQIKLSGLAADDTLSPGVEYRFAVSR
jgi:hypothetical protein